MVNVITAPNPSKTELLRRIRQGASFAAIILGVIVLFGWAIGSHAITSIIPGWVDMKVNTALSFVLSGVALLLVEPTSSQPPLVFGWKRAVAIVASLVVFTIGLLTTLEYSLGVSFGIDELFFRDFLQLGLAYHPGRISPITAANLVCTGVAICALALNRPAYLSEFFASCVVFTTLVVLTGAAYGLQSMLAGGRYTAVALHTNLGFALVSAGIFCANGTGPIMRLMSDGGSAGKVARRLLPAAMLVPLSISWLCAWAVGANVFGIELAVSVFTISTIVAFVVLVWLSASYLQRSEKVARLTDDKLRGSRQRYTFLAESIPQMVWTTKPDGEVDYFNQRWFDYTGLTSAQTLDWGWKAVVHPDDLANCISCWTQSLKTGERYEVEYRLKRADGVYLWHLGRGNALHNDAGEIIEWVGTCTDIDAQKQTRRALEERVAERTLALANAREKLEAVLGAATQIAIISADLSGRIEVFNTGAERMLGYKAEEILGKSPEIFHLRSEVEARARQLSAELGRELHGFEVFVEKARMGQHEEREWTYVRQDGSMLAVNLIVTASRNAEGTIVGFLGIATDITARKQADKKLRDQALILDLANDTIFIRDRSNRVTFWNQGAQRLYGWSSKQAVGHVTHTLLQTQFPEPLAEIDAQLEAEGHWEGELIHRRRDGVIVTVASSWTLQRDEAGVPVSVIEMNHDITARKQAQRELQESRERLHTILDSSLDGVIVYNAVRDEAGAICDYRFAMINPAAEKMMNESAAYLLGSSLVERFPHVVTDGLVEKFERIVEKNEVLDFEYQSRRFDVPRWYRIAGVKLGEGLVISYADITTRKIHEQELHDAKERAEFADRSKSDFLANMSHEIRTPMNGVIGMTGLLLDTHLDTEQRNLAETIRSSSESLLGLLNDILDFSKIEAGKLTFEELDFNLRKVLEDSLEMMAGQATVKGLELIGGIETGMTTKLRGDPGRVHQILTNLIGNAIKFTRTGEVAVRVKPEVETASDVVVRFEVHDTGIGISSEAQTQLFQPFMQADLSTSRKFGGTGLGLAICKRLAESMHGTIGVESVPGQGSTFWVKLKFARQLEAPMERPPAHAFVDTRVLVVDDNETSRGFLRQQIVAWRMRDGCAASGEEALALLREAAVANAPYSIAIIDLEMPGMDGLALVRKINADPRLHATKLILLTPLGRPIPAADFKSVQIAACCAKPVRQSGLYDSIVQVLVAPTDAAKSKPSARVEDTVPLRKERILVAEDNIVNQRVALGNLRKLGYTADVVANGLEVLEAIEIKKYDIILMDCHMPELDGYQVTREIRKREKNGRHVRIIAMTANVMVGDREKCLSAGMDDYVSKPLRRGELHQALEKCAVTAFNSTAAIDEKALRALGDEGESDLAELIELFVASAPQSITDMKRAVDAGDAKALAFAAHTLKGSCGNLGKFPLYEICAQLEQIGRNGNLDGVGDLVASAENELRRLVDALSLYLKPKSAV